MRPSLASLLGGAAALSTLWFSGAAVSAAPSVELETDPPLSDVIPFSRPTTLALTALDDSGQPLEDANFDLTLLTPPKTPWWTSDFPIVEGTTLLELTLPAPEGTAQFQNTMPIRGTYQLQVSVTPQVPGSFEPYIETLTLKVPENPVKYRNVAILLSILFMVGLGGGWIIGGEQTVIAGETAPRRVQWLLSGAALTAIAVMLYISITAERADAHASGHDDAQPEVVETEPVPEDIIAEIDDQAIATVGQMIPLAVTAADASGEPLDNAVLDVEVRSVEYGRAVTNFTAQTDAEGEFTWQQQFVDGAPHQIIVDVAPASGDEGEFTPFTLSKTIDVNGVAPPVSTRIISLSYFTLFLAMGMGTGYWLKQRVSGV
ncbi:MAG: hypothetical protein WBA43_05665 [Elainellaceae cyanobacterium]